MDGGAWKAAVHGVAKSDMTERFHFHFSLLCIGEGNDNPLQCSCLEDPRDEGAWWAVVYGVTQSDTTETTQQQRRKRKLRECEPEESEKKTVSTSFMSQKCHLLCFNISTCCISESL